MKQQKTTFILHGGETRVSNEHNRNFYRAWVDDFEDHESPVILLSYLSRNKEEWKGLFQNDQDNFGKYTNNRNVEFIFGSEDLSEFKDQVKSADVIYFRGGSSDLILERLSPIKEELLSLFKGKVYVGSSAGVMALAHWARSHTSDWKKCFGLLPFNVVVHWSEAMREDLENFKKHQCDNDYEFLLVPETEFIVKKISY